MITSTSDRLVIVEPTANLTAIAMAEGGVALRIGEESAFLAADDVAALVAWLGQVNP